MVFLPQELVSALGPKIIWLECHSMMYLGSSSDLFLFPVSNITLASSKSQLLRKLSAHFKGPMLPQKTFWETANCSNTVQYWWKFLSLVWLLLHVCAFAIFILSIKPFECVIIHYSQRTDQYNYYFIICILSWPIS